MSTFERSVVIQAPVVDVFDFLADRACELQWNPDCQSVERLTDGPVGLGTQWRVQWSGRPKLVVETTAFDRPRSSTSSSSGPLEVTVSFTCTETAAGTEVHVRFAVIPHAVMRVMYPLFRRRFEAQTHVNMQRIKSALETDQATNSAPDGRA